MRDLVLKQISSQDKKKRAISSCEISREGNLHTRLVRHFICMVRKMDTPGQTLNFKPQIYVHKYLDTQTHRESFLYRLKGKVCLVQNKELYIVDFCHSVRICVEQETEVHMR